MPNANRFPVYTCELFRRDIAKGNDLLQAKELEKGSKRIAAFPKLLNRWLSVTQHTFVPIVRMPGERVPQDELVRRQSALE